MRGSVLNENPRFSNEEKNIYSLQKKINICIKGKQYQQQPSKVSFVSKYS